MIDIKTLMETEGLYATRFPTGEEFTWRLLTLREYKVFCKLREASVMMPIVLYSEVFDYCYLGNSDAISFNVPAGYFPTMGELIMWLSGDCASNEAEEIEIARSKYRGNSVFETMKRTVLLAFPYTPDEIEDWSRAELCRKFTIAEAVLVQKGKEYVPIDTSQIMSADQLAKKKKKGPAIDFKKENAAYNEAMGDASNVHILDRHPDVLAQKQKQTKAVEERKMIDERKMAQQLERATKKMR